MNRRFDRSATAEPVKQTRDYPDKHKVNKSARRLRRRLASLVSPLWRARWETTMRGLAIPADAEFDREPSNEYGTPFSNNDDSIPIDPALGGTPIDPALLGSQSNEQNGQVSTQLSLCYIRVASRLIIVKRHPEPACTPPPQEPPKHFSQYSQAPQ